MKRIIIALVIAVTVVAAGAAGTAGTAWGASGSPTSAVITFDDQGQQAILQIPDPPCDTTMPNCVWKFFLNEPKLSVDVAIVYGTSGTLTIPYPANFCGIIQADAYVGPTDQGPWQSKRGWQHPINTSSDNCEPSTTTTTTDAPDTTPKPPTEPSSTPPAAAPVTAPTPTEPQVTPVVAAAVATPTTTTTEPAKPAAAVTSLPFTGVNLEPFAILGVLFVALGLGLLVRRRKPTT